MGLKTPQKTVENFTVFVSPKFQKKYKLSKHPHRRRTFDKIFKDWQARGGEKRTAAQYWREHGGTLDCDQKTIHRWLKEAENVYADWKCAPASVAKAALPHDVEWKEPPKARVKTKEERELHEDIMAKASQEVANNMASGRIRLGGPLAFK